MTLVRDALLAQEIARINDRIEHYAGRVDRGSADMEDVTALALYRQMLIALGELQTPRGRVVVPELDHDAMMLTRFGRHVSPHGRIERRIVAALCAHMIERGWRPCGLDDTDRITPVTDAKSAMELIFNLDDAWLYFSNGHAQHPVRLIMGNGADIISDWGFNHDDADGFDAAMDAFDAAVYA